MRKSILLGTILVLAFTLAPFADAYEANWGASKFIIKYDVKVPGEGKSKLKNKEWSFPISLDSTLGTTLRYRIATDGDPIGLDIGIEGKSSRKANVVSVSPDDIEKFVTQMNEYLDSRQQKTGSMDFVAVDIDEIKSKGKLNVNGKYSKCSCKVKFKFTGTVAEGEYEGEEAKGSLQLILKGDRD